MPTPFHLYQDKKKSKEHTLEIDFMHAYDKSLTEDYTVRVILPEGAEDIRIELPQEFEIDSITKGKFFGTLDYFGRPELTIKKLNAVHELLDHTLRVRYTFNNERDLYLEPVFIFAMLFSLFFAAMIYSRIGLDLENVKKAKTN